MWNGNEFYLSIENQINFGNMYIIRDILQYPTTVKTQEGFLELKNAEEVSDFYMKAVAFVKSCIEEGWAKKSAAEASIRERFNKE